jgi:hypothetical protein
MRRFGARVLGVIAMMTQSMEVSLRWQC